jgi:predicted nucleotidyltransferase
MLQESTACKVLSVFFKEPTTRHYLKEISRKAGAAHTSVSNIIKSTKYIKKEIEIRNTREFPHYISIQNQEFYQEKLLFNLKELRPLTNYLRDNLMPDCIVLFGSYSRGEDTEDSDIELFIQCKEENINLKEFDKTLRRKIHLIFRNNFRNLPKDLKNNIINGISLYGALTGY